MDLKSFQSLNFSINLIQLNLPPFEYKVKKAEDKLWIFDVIRKKYILLLPEEWVRQHFIHYLLMHNYPKSLIRVEGGLVFNQLKKRADIVIFNRAGNPWMIIECKSPEIPISDETLFQAAVYNKTLQASMLVVTNGLNHLYAKVDWNEGSTQKLHALPAFPDL